MVVTLFLMLLVAACIVTPIAAVILGLLSQRRAQLSGGVTLGAVGLAARIWAWYHLVGLVAGAVVLGALALLCVYFLAHLEPPRPRATYWDPAPAPYQLAQPRR